ncbi:ImmA/IrrE family metallo-endopeptidase [Alkalimonas sp. NCh-2]|uniref:ImmA/IrrE family metallo-endopeptidase n=1 Tax=Alkalimonas sp. NCh-2 TaxID=3144846 RepID=UPI0031F6B056
MSQNIPNDWDDFELFKSSEHSSGVALYESYKSLKNHFSHLPKKELVARGWISSENDIASLTDLFRDIHADQTGTLFRRSDSANLSLSSIWLSKVKSYAKAKIATGSISDFKGLSKDELKVLAQLSPDTNIIVELPNILAKKGIAMIYCRSLPGMKVDGAALKLSSGHPVIGISLRYSRLDYFWFTLIHELSHISLHLDILENPILDDLDTDAESEIEISANRLAKQTFVDRSVWRNCEPKYNKSIDAITKFSESIGIHRSIVAGMLRRESGNYASYSSIVNEYDVREIIFNGN